MGGQVFQLFSAVITGQVYAVPAGIGRQTSVHSQSGIDIQQRDLFFRGRLADQVVVQTDPVIVQVAGPAGGSYTALVHGGYGLGIDHSPGLTGAYGIDGFAIGPVKGICVNVTQLVDAETEIYLGIFFQSQGI